ncbi:MAG: hypothetical protein DDT32_01012 [Syntrophomonadaceae bacterium]|nr:hypothetical protein [Bacillota bacterium]
MDYAKILRQIFGTAYNTVFVGSFASPNPDYRRDFTNTENVRRNLA